jgi:recombination protein RecA
MISARASLVDVVRARASDAALPAGVRRGLPHAQPPMEWGLAALAGRFGEVSAERSSAALTLAFRLVLEAQRRGEPVAWIARSDSVFYPPDAANAGVDLGALVVVRAGHVLAAARAADHLLRSGGFGLVILDRGSDARLPIHAQTRLAGLAKKHDAALLCLTEKSRSRASIGSLGPGWTYGEVCRGPDGLR